MCAQHVAKGKFYNSYIFYILAILLAFLSGFSNIDLLQNFGVLTADIFIRIFKCISLPIISLSIIVTISTYSVSENPKKIWLRTLLYTFSTTIMAACVSFILYLLINPENIHNLHDINTIENKEVTYFQYLLSFIPSNIFSPFLEQQVMGVLFLGLIIGISIHYIPENDSRETVINFFKGIHSLFLTITKWIIVILPVGLYGFITTTLLQLREETNLKSIGKYLAIIILANLLQGFVVLPLWLKLNHIRPYKLMKGAMAALSLAFFSKSSTSTLPITIEVSEKNLSINPKISRLILPLCTSINMNGCAAFIFTTVIYIMQNHGVEITLWTMFIWIGVATISAIGNAGVPMGCFFLSASLLVSLDIPISLLSIILPFYGMIDMIETALNVWSDICVTKVIDQKENLENERACDLRYARRSPMLTASTS